MIEYQSVVQKSPLIALTTLGLLISMVIHLLAWVGVPLPTWLIFGLTLSLFIPFMIVMIYVSNDPVYRELRRNFRTMFGSGAYLFAGVPKWMIAVGYAFVLYLWALLTLERHSPD